MEGWLNVKVQQFREENFNEKGLDKKRHSHNSLDDLQVIVQVPVVLIFKKQHYNKVGYVWVLLVFNVFAELSLFILYFSPVRLGACILNKTTSNGMSPENGTLRKMHPGVS